MGTPGKRSTETTTAGAITASPETNTETTTGGLQDPAKKKIAEQITSTFENSDLNLHYDYAENIGDGRGITAGRAGFTSGTGDLVQVVKRYVEESPDNNPLARYVAPLEAINKKREQSGKEKIADTTGLSGFDKAWKEASDKADGKLNKIQDEEVDKMYFNPAMAQAKAAGVTSAAGQMIIFDTAIQHGPDGDAHGLKTIIKETIAKEGKATKANEETWLKAFLEIRRKHLEQSYKDSADSADVTTRIDALEQILQSGLDLSGPLQWTVYGDKFSLDKNDTPGTTSPKQTNQPRTSSDTTRTSPSTSSFTKASRPDPYTW